MACEAMLRDVMLCHDMLCYATLCRAMVHYAMADKVPEPPFVGDLERGPSVADRGGWLGPMKRLGLAT